MYSTLFGKWLAETDCLSVVHAKKKMLVISNRLLIISTPVGQQRQLLLSSTKMLIISIYFFACNSEIAGLQGLPATPVINYNCKV